MISSITFFVFFLVIMIFLPLDKIFVRKNLSKLIGELNAGGKRTRKAGKSLFDSIFVLCERIYGLWPFKLSSTAYEKYKNNLLLAGLEEKMSVEIFFGIKLSLFLFGFVYVFSLFLCTSSVTFGLLTLLVPVIAFVYPEAYLDRKIKRRRSQLQMELPGVLNALAIITEAGLNLLEAIKKIAETREGVLISELKKMLDEINVGILQKDALLRLGERCRVTEVSLFASTISQSLQKGSAGVVNVLKEQAREAWEKRKNRARELGEKASMKLFIPMLLLVFPCLLIFLLGPALISALKAF